MWALGTETGREVRALTLTPSSQPGERRAGLYTGVRDQSSRPTWSTCVQSHLEDVQGARGPQFGSRNTRETRMCSWSHRPRDEAPAQNTGEVNGLNLAVTSFLWPWGRQVSLPCGDPKPAQRGTGLFLLCSRGVPTYFLLPGQVALASLLPATHSLSPQEPVQSKILGSVCSSPSPVALVANSLIEERLYGI